MNQMTEFMMMSGLFGNHGASVIWIQLGLLVILTAIVVYRRDVIIRLSSYRLSFLLLSLSFIVPAILGAMNPLLVGMTSSRRNGIPEAGLFTLFLGFVQAVPPLLIGLSVLSLFRAIVPKFIPPVDQADNNGPPPGNPGRKSPGANAPEDVGDFDPF